MSYVYDDGCCKHGRIYTAEEIAAKVAAPAPAPALDRERLARALDAATVEVYTGRTTGPDGEGSATFSHRQLTADAVDRIADAYESSRG